jgi:hypothetical protein
MALPERSSRIKLPHYRKSESIIQGRLFGEVASVFGRSNYLVFASGIAAFGGDWSETTSNARLVMQIGRDGVRFGDYLTGGGDGFLGVVASDLFAEVHLTDEAIVGLANEPYTLDNVSFSSVPAPRDCSRADQRCGCRLQPTCMETSRQMNLNTALVMLCVFAAKTTVLHFAKSTTDSRSRFRMRDLLIAMTLAAVAAYLLSHLLRE